MSKALLFLGATVTIVVAVLVLMRPLSPNDSSRSKDATGKVVHVHGLATDSKGGGLYAATHSGLFRIQDGTAVRVGRGTQDTMGFTILGSGQFLGSGHPDYDDYQAGKAPPLLGLIKSDDSGRSWQSVSLRGKADFHALRVAGNRIFGLDSSSETLMISDDGGKTWETRPKIAMFDVAVDPRNPQSLIATTATGLIESSDAGQSWGPLGSQIFIFLSWVKADRLIAVDGKGSVYWSEDQGEIWQALSPLPGVPEALLDTGDRVLYAAVREKGIYVSLDDGRSWRVYYQDPV